MNDPQEEGEEIRPLRFDVFTLFPGMFESPLAESILKRAQDRNLIQIDLHNIRDWTTDKHRTADDTPYGGGAGMVMKAPPIVEAVESVLADAISETHVVLLAAGGRRFTQGIARELSGKPRIALICGRYEGIDDRVREILRCDEISIGDYVLTGGELPAMVLIDSVSRLVPGVIEDESISEESFSNDLVEYPHFTRPLEYRGLQVPEVLLSGHHANVRAWRLEQSRARTAARVRRSDGKPRDEGTS